MENTLENLTEKSAGINLTTAFDQMLIPFKNTLEKAKAVAKVSQLKKVDSFFDNLTLKLVKTETDYWDNLTVTSDAERFNRWVFAIMSVHTTWESNVRGYNVAMKDLSWTIDKKRLEEMVVEARVGMYERRNRGLWQLAQKFRENPEQFKKQDDETWQECRNRLVGTIYGLGNAKTTYGLALSNPVDAQLCCLDVHLLRFLGHDQDGQPNLKIYQAMEDEWLDRCDKYGVSPNVAREIYWNKVQGRRNSRYWSYCLEN
jgi:thermostable 8-oxoguanine DNA glycosylase